MARQLFPSKVLFSSLCS